MVYFEVSMNSKNRDEYIQELEDRLSFYIKNYPYQFALGEHGKYKLWMQYWCEETFETDDPERIALAYDHMWFKNEEDYMWFLLAFTHEFPRE